MNEKIKELRKQAIIKKVEHYSWGDPAITHHLDEEKFAELIIRECYKIAMKEGNGFYCPSDILDNFGIEK